MTKKWEENTVEIIYPNPQYWKNDEKQLYFERPAFCYNKGYNKQLQ
jgi:hypothetical protein